MVDTPVAERGGSPLGGVVFGTLYAWCVCVCVGDYGVVDTPVAERGVRHLGVWSLEPCMHGVCVCVGDYGVVDTPVAERGVRHLGVWSLEPCIAWCVCVGDYGVVDTPVAERGVRHLDRIPVRRPHPPRSSRSGPTS